MPPTLRARTRAAHRLRPAPHPSGKIADNFSLLPIASHPADPESARRSPARPPPSSSAQSASAVAVRASPDARPLSTPVARRSDISSHPAKRTPVSRSEEHTSELQSLTNLVCRLLL